MFDDGLFNDGLFNDGLNGFDGLNRLNGRFDDRFFGGRFFVYGLSEPIDGRLFGNRFFNDGLFISGLFGDVTEIHTVVENNGFELREGTVHEFPHGSIGREGDLVSTFNHETVARLHIHALTVLGVDNLERTQAADLQQLLVLQHLIDKIHQFVDELDVLLSRQTVLLGEQIDQVLFCLNHSLPLRSLVFP